MFLCNSTEKIGSPQDDDPMADAESEAYRQCMNGGYIDIFHVTFNSTFQLPNPGMYLVSIIKQCTTLHPFWYPISSHVTPIASRTHLIHRLYYYTGDTFHEDWMWNGEEWIPREEYGQLPERTEGETIQFFQNS